MIATDLTAQSASALRLAGAIGQNFGAEIVVAHVVPMPGALRRWSHPSFRADLKSYGTVLTNQCTAAERDLERQVSTAGLSSVRGVRTVVESGRPAPTLARLVEELNADLIIVGRGRGGKLGPVAEQLVRLIGRTVLVAPVRSLPAAPVGRGRPLRPRHRGTAT